MSSSPPFTTVVHRKKAILGAHGTSQLQPPSPSRQVLRPSSAPSSSSPTKLPWARMPDGRSLASRRIYKRLSPKAVEFEQLRRQHILVQEGMGRRKGKGAEGDDDLFEDIPYDTNVYSDDDAADDDTDEGKAKEEKDAERLSAPTMDDHEAFPTSSVSRPRKGRKRKQQHAFTPFSKPPPTPQSPAFFTPSAGLPSAPPPPSAIPQRTPKERSATVANGERKAQYESPYVFKTPRSDAHTPESSRQPSSNIRGAFSTTPKRRGYPSTPLSSSLRGNSPNPSVGFPSAYNRPSPVSASAAAASRPLLLLQKMYGHLLSLQVRHDALDATNVSLETLLERSFCSTSAMTEAASALNLQLQVAEAALAATARSRETWAETVRRGAMGAMRRGGVALLRACVGAMKSEARTGRRRREKAESIKQRGEKRMTRRALEVWKCWREEWDWRRTRLGDIIGKGERGRKNSVLPPSLPPRRGHEDDIRTRKQSEGGAQKPLDRSWPRRRLRRRFVIWREAVSRFNNASKAVALLFEALPNGYRRVKLTKAFEKLFSFACEHMTVVNARLGHIARRISSRRKRDCFESWRAVVGVYFLKRWEREESTNDTSRHVKLQPPFYSSVSSSSSSSCSSAPRRSTVRALLLGLSSSLRRRSLCLAFRRLCEQGLEFQTMSLTADLCSVRKEQKELLEEVVKLRAGRSKAFDRMRVKAFNVMSRVVNGQVLDALQLWKGAVLEQKRKEAVRERFVNKWRHRPAAKALELWKELVGTRKGLRRIMNRAVGERDVKLKAAAWNSWKSFSETFEIAGLEAQVSHLSAIVEGLQSQLREKEEEAGALKRFRDNAFEKNKIVAIKVMNKIVCGLVTDAFALWKGAAFEARRLDAVRQRFALKWKMKPAQQALNQWKEMAKMRCKMRNFLKRMFCDKNMKLKAAALRTWKERVEEEEAIALEREVDSLSVELEKLCEERDRQAEEITSLKKIVESLTGDKKVKAFKTMQRIVNGLSAVAFTTWKTNVAEMVRNEHILKKFVKRMSLQGVARAITTWRELVATRKRMRSFVVKYFLSKNGRLKAVAWRTWRHYVTVGFQENAIATIEQLRAELEAKTALYENLLHDKARCDEIIAKNKVEKRRSSQVNIAKFVGMWQNQSLSWTFQSWRVWAATEKGNKRLLRNFVGKMMNQKLVSVWNSWVNHTSFIRRSEKLLAKFLKRWTNRITTKCLLGWVKFVTVSKEEKAEEELKEKRARGCIMKMLNSRQLRLFNTWRDNAAEQRRNREIVKKFAARMILAGAARALNVWKELVATRKWLKRLMGRMMGGTQLKLLSCGFFTWKDNIRAADEGERAALLSKLESLAREQEEKISNQMKQIEELESHIRKQFGSQQEKAVAVIVKMFNVKVGAAFRAWFEWAETLKKNEVVVQRFVARFRLAGASRAFATWKELRSVRKWLRKFMIRMVGGRRVAMLSSGFAAWRNRVKELNLDETNNEVDSLYDQLDSYKETVDELKERLAIFEARYLSELLEKKDRAMKVMMRIFNAKLTLAFEFWRDSMRQSKHNEEVRHKFALRMRLRGAMRALTCWKEMTTTRKFLRRFMHRMLGDKTTKLKAAAIRTWVNNARGYKEGQEKLMISRLEEICNEQAVAIEELNEEVEFFKHQLEQVQGEREAAQSAVLKKFLQTWQNKSTFKVFTAWKGYVKRSKEQLVRLRRAVSKWHANLVHRILLAWRDYIVSKKREKKRSMSFKEGEWQEFLRDARTPTSKARAGSSFFNAADDDPRYENEEDYEEVQSVSSSAGVGGGRGTPTATAGGRQRFPSSYDIYSKEISTGVVMSPTAIRGMTTVDLQAALQERGLPTTGSKPALIARLTACLDFLSPRSKNAMNKANSWGEGGGGAGGVDEAVQNQIASFAENLVGHQGGEKKRPLAEANRLR